MTNLITTSYPCGTNLPILFKLGKIYKLKVNLIFFKKVGFFFKKKKSPHHKHSWANFDNVNKKKMLVWLV